MNTRANIRRALTALAALASYGAAAYFRMSFTGPYPFVHGVLEPYGPDTRTRIATVTCTMAFFIPLHFLIARLLRDPAEPIVEITPSIPSRARDPLMYLATMSNDPHQGAPTRSPRR